MLRSSKGSDSFRSSFPLPLALLDAMNSKAASKPLTGHLHKLVKQRRIAEKFQVEELISHFHHLLSRSPHPNHRPSLIAITQHLKLIASSDLPTRYSTVISLFNHMKHTRPIRASPDRFTFGLVLDCCCRMGRGDLGFCVLGQSLRQGCGAHTIMFNSLIKDLCAQNQIGAAVKVFAKMSFVGCAPCLITYSTLIDFFCRNGSTRNGLDEGSCCKPDVVTYSTLINGFCMGGEIAVAIEMFQEMVAEGVSPDIIAFNILIDG